MGAVLRPPFTGLRAIPEVLRAAVTDPAVRALPPRGGVEQWVDDVGTLNDADLRRRLAQARVERSSQDGRVQG
ncbi:hypothetical protein [Promicromonospora soli]